MIFHRRGAVEEIENIVSVQWAVQLMTAMDLDIGFGLARSEHAADYSRCFVIYNNLRRRNRNKENHLFYEILHLISNRIDRIIMCHFPKVDVCWIIFYLHRLRIVCQR